ncbi:MAG: sugar phosphate isomerase/epimerase [Candidatus Peregrinibacteria bacterium]
MTSKLGKFFRLLHISLLLEPRLETTMVIRLGAHWLAFLWDVSTRGPLSDAVRKARSAGATVFELIYHALNGLSPSKTADSLKAGGITRAGECVFFPDGEDGAEPPMGDPLSDNAKQRGLALKTFRRILGFMVALRAYGITINLLGGPSCWVLGKDYGLDWVELRRRILRFYKELEVDLRAAEVRIAIEFLRIEEDLVVQTPAHAAELVDALNTAIHGNMFGVLLDTFHVAERGYDQVATVRTLGKRIIHLHLNGAKRRPAGGDGDTIQWPELVVALDELGLERVDATYEPFCALVREKNSALGEGLPAPVDEPGGIVTTRETLTASGMEVVTT